MKEGGRMEELEGGMEKRVENYDQHSAFFLRSF